MQYVNRHKILVCLVKLGYLGSSKKENAKRTRMGHQDCMNAETQKRWEVRRNTPKPKQVLFCQSVCIGC